MEPPALWEGWREGDTGFCLDKCHEIIDYKVKMAVGKNMKRLSYDGIKI